MELFTAATTGGIITLIINGVAYWIREWRKHRTWQSNGKDLKEIKSGIGTLQLDIAKLQQSADDQKKQCTTTVNRFDTAIRDQNKELLAIAKKRQ